MFGLIRSFIVCMMFFLVLSINIQDKPVFYHIYSVTSHVTVPVQKMVGTLFTKAADSTTAYSRKLFDNSVPKFKDAVKSKASAPSRKSAGGNPEEIIHVEEKKELDQLIKTHRH